MVLRGELAELMVLIEPALYRKYVTVDSKRRKVLYVRMHKALYGMLRSALLFYRKLVKDLKGDGFQINPYDPCVANRMVNGKQQTVIWHVDDLKASHVDPGVNTAFGQWLKVKYGDCKEHRWKHHEYLGMDLDYSEQGKVKIRMVPYLKGIHLTIDGWQEGRDKEGFKKRKKAVPRRLLIVNSIKPCMAT